MELRQKRSMQQVMMMLPKESTNPLDLTLCYNNDDGRDGNDDEG